MARINYYVNCSAGDAAHSNSTNIAQWATDAIVHRFPGPMVASDKREVGFSIPLIPNRINLVASVVIPRAASSLIPEDFVFLDAAVFGVMKRSCNTGWSTLTMHQNLPATGTGGGRMGLFDSVSAVRRFVDNGTQPDTNEIPGNSVIPATVVDSNVSEHLGAHVNSQAGNGLDHASKSLGDWFTENRTPIYLVGTLVGLVCVAAIVKNVREII